jgi:RNA polymerase sigma factor for flagellar operon FliA
MVDVDKSVWDRFRAGDRQAYDQLVDTYIPLVKITIGRMAMNLPRHIDYEELYSTGCMGLLSAINRYDPTREAKFTTYAITRIRGSVIDELRTHDVLGRITRDRVTRIHKAEKELQRQGKAVTAEEVAEIAELTMDEYHDAMIGDRASHIISLSEPINSDEGFQTLGDMIESQRAIGADTISMENEELLEYIQEMLDEREKLLVVLYYDEELTLKEIADVMELSESRVSQLHSQMVEKVRKNMKKIGI